MKNIKPYTTTRKKSRKFLSNNSYVDVNKDNIYNKGFIFDVYSLIVKKLNPFSLERKTNDQNKQEMVYMLLKECVLLEFYKYISSEENFIYLNGEKRALCKGIWNGFEFYWDGCKKLYSAEDQLTAI